MFRKLPIAVKASAFLLIASFLFTIGVSHPQAASAAAPSNLVITATSPSGCASTSVNWTLSGTNPIDPTTITFSVSNSAGTFSPSGVVSVPSTAAVSATGAITFTPTLGTTGTAQIGAVATSGATTLNAAPVTISIACANSTGCTTTTYANCNCSSLVLGQCNCDNITIPCSNCGTLYSTLCTGNCYGATISSYCSACGLSSLYSAGCGGGCGGSLYNGGLNNGLYGGVYGGYNGYNGGYAGYNNGCNNSCGVAVYNACVPPTPCTFVGCGTACYSYNTGCSNICTTTYCNGTCGTLYPGYNNSYYNNSLCAGPPANVTLSVPASVSCGSQTDVTAVVTDYSGSRVADGTPVSFSTNLGYVTGSANTSGGSAIASLQVAPRMSGVATVTVMVGNVTKTAQVTLNCAPVPSFDKQSFGPGPIQQAIQQFAPQLQQTFRPPNTGSGGLLGNVIAPSTDENCD